MKKESKARDRIVHSALTQSLIGGLGVLASALIAEQIHPTAGSLSSALLAALTTISIALIGFALFSIYLDTKNWQEYFSERIKDIVIESEYLNGLGLDTLKEIQTRVLKAQCNNHAIDKEGSFLHYFNLNLHRYISEPYREDVSTEVMMKLIDGRSDAFLVVDKVRYVCRSSGGSIQSHVSWKPDKDEFEKVNSLKIAVQCPPTQNEGARETLYCANGEKLESDLQSGIKISLEKYADVDYLAVTTESEYIVNIGRFQNWQMAHPSKNFDITILYPPQMEIQFKTLVLEDVMSQITEQEGYLKFSYGAWALPQSGMVWLVKNA